MSTSAIEDAYMFLRGHTTADLRFDEHFRPLKFVIAPDGKLIAPVMVAMLQAADTVLFAPEYVDGAMELQVTMESFEERGKQGALADRWRIYHGEPPDVRWAIMTIDMVRFGEVVIDGEALTRPNPLTKDEGKLCQYMNQQHAEDLSRMSIRFSPTRMKIEKPVMVGIDPLGIDVRALFDIVRIPATRPMINDQVARKVLDEMIQQAGTAKAGPTPA